eukprot:scaffold98701_cov17-Tisochrysis_lutea.AAC.1
MVVVAANPAPCFLDHCAANFTSTTNTNVMKGAFPAASHDEKNGKLLWDWSEKMVGLSNQMRTSGTPMFTLECLIAHTYTCRAYWQFALGQI